MKDLIHNAVEICEKGNLRLHKISCNNSEVMLSLPESERATITQTDLEPCQKSFSPEKVLGIQWCIESDTFCFKLTLKDHPLTRRGILATVASIYDPLGLISPLVLVGKMILQRMCQDRSDWDDPLPDDLRPDWECWNAELLKLSEIKIPRCFIPDGLGQAVSVQLHHFSDASLSGYGQCSYVRLKTTDERVHCALVMAKARVAPLMPVTIPRLELQAATISAKVSKVLETEMGYKDMSHHFWMDSKVVLGYIKNDTKRLKIFVANRVQRIREVSQPTQWKYVPTTDNPADYATRGLTADEIAKSNWLTGPKFLWETEASPQTADIDLEIPPDDVEVKPTVVHIVQQMKFTSFTERMSRFSSYSKAVTAVAVIVECSLKKREKLFSKIQVRNLAETNLIRVIQQETFEDSIQNLQKRYTSSHRDDPLKNLDPFLDENGLLRVGGRLKRSAFLYGVKHPILLPKRNHFSTLVESHYHGRIGHQGRSMTINEIRNHGCWIVGCRSTVSSLIQNCVTCKKLRGRRVSQKMANLPEDRTEPSPPFTHCGLDCFGQFIVKEGRKELKRYGLIFTCLASRAVHIEDLDYMSTDSFINALRCLIAIRGKVLMIRCDQGTNFVGASHELKENLNKLNIDSIARKLLSQNCEFLFNTPSSSHMGGVWERQIRTIRNVSDGILIQNGTQLNTSALHTFLFETMAIINSRPLTVDDLEDPNGPLPLSPNNILTMKSGIVTPPPPGDFVREDIYARKRSPISGQSVLDKVGKRIFVQSSVKENLARYQRKYQSW
ncbi:uncharacterized protein LOC102809358 [Saccoglossus kowalevskii]|uniref:Uncharacterized protein LOC102809358 n=1 Tax=Saccoglossus kowalevskii TaxID=10224 RepID=A0ABM0MUK7_SACKO|nr:PREDICTED: uncharacterized protein LOC102809358 [Saccoglossus kowalevskii]